MTSHDREYKPRRFGARGLQGFSLLEMMTVISLILVLATFATPIHHNSMVLAREGSLREELRY